MEFVIFMGGVVIGIIAMYVYTRKERIHGIIHLDHETKQCLINITSDELSNPKKKIAVFVIDHKAEISREEQTL